MSLSSVPLSPINKYKTMKYKYLHSVIKFDLLKDELSYQGNQGWKLITAIILQSIKPGLTINGTPQIELTYHLIFIKEDNENI